MVAYVYHSETKEFLDTYQAQIDPLESKLQGKDIYLLPADSTWIKPPEFDKEIYQAFWTGEDWDIQVIPKPEEPEEPILTPSPIALASREGIEEC